MQIGRMGRLFRPFHIWFEANGPDAIPWVPNPMDGSKDLLDFLPGVRKPIDGSKDVLDAAAEFVETVATADQMLNAIPVSALELLSGLTGGVRWDVRTRRVLRAIQHESSILECHSLDPEGLLLGLWWMGEDGLKQMQSKLMEIKLELTERILDLDSLPFLSYTIGSEKEAPTPEDELPPAKSGGGPSRPTKAKRGTERGEGREKLIAALTKHHKYADGSSLNQEPVGNNALARLAGVSVSTASAFFEKEFGGLKKYKAICSDVSRLITALKLINQEFSPLLLFGAKPADEGEREDEG